MDGLFMTRNRSENRAQGEVWKWLSWPEESGRIVSHPHPAAAHASCGEVQEWRKYMPQVRK
jgi:hypothetical protein